MRSESRPYRPPQHGLVRIGRYFVLLLVTLVMIGPLLWMLRVAFLPTGSPVALPALLTSLFSIDNFLNLLNNAEIIQALSNSLLVGVFVTVANILFCFLAGYALARRRVIGGRVIFASLMLTLMLPAHALIIPLYLMMTSLGMFDSLWALTLPFLVTPFGIFLMRQYFASIPESLEEAARIDGASEFRILFRILMPLCRPALAVLAIQIFLTNWNSFLYPFILTNSSNLRTLPVALALLQGYQAIDWQRLMAGSTLAVAPVMIIFIIFQRQIVAGVTAGAIKQ